jgi:pyruvate/2-oxoglutarate dehydrogenase complex dihydrolipoamide dehydrogenase (E3) component
VTLIEAGRIAPREDPELADGLRRAIAAQGTTPPTAQGATAQGATAQGATAQGAGQGAAQGAGQRATHGVTLIENASVVAVESGPTLVLADGRRIAGSHLLVATGRRPNLEHLALQAGNVRASPAGIVTDRGLRSVTNRRVFAIGDIADPVGIGPRAFTHVGSYHASIVIRRALFRLPARLDYAALPRVIYTTPELAQVGLTESEARAAGHRVTLLRAPLAENDRAVAEGDPTGLVKLVISGNRVLGAGILAPHAGEMIGQWTLAIARRVPAAVLVGLMAPYPTLAEAGKRALSGLFAPRLFAARTKSLVRLLIRLP